MYPWPCIGQYKFVSLTLHRQPLYGRVVETIKAGGRYLDLGCAVAQDMRYLVLDGCPSDNMFGLEKMAGYVEQAYELFGDRDRLHTRFIVADLLDTDVAEAQALLGTVDVAHAGMLLHVWPLEPQRRACERIVQFMSPRKGALIVGNSVGRTEPIVWPGPEGTPMYKHSPESFKSMWDDVGRRTGTVWRVHAWTRPGLGLNDEAAHWDDPLTTRLYWEVERME